MPSIKEYQEAYTDVLEKLKKNSQIIAVVVYGSIIYGDIWEGSDIDFMVITKEKNKVESIYSKVLNVPIHIYYISKDIFIDSYKNLLKGGTFHKAFFAGRLVFCSDSDIKNIHLSTRFYGDRDKNARNIELLCHLLNSIHYARKYQSVGKPETAYQWCFEILKNYARLLMSMKGHITDKDILSLAVSMNDEIDYLFKLLNSNMEIKDKIDGILDTAEKYVDSNIETISKPVIEFLRNKKEMSSVQEIKNSDDFRQIDGDLNLLLEVLSSRRIIKQGMRRYVSYGDEYLIDEVVYYAD